MQINNLFLEIKFSGGLGNQMFQYATARSLGIRNEIPYLLLNTDRYINEPLDRTFSLAKLNIIGKVIRGNFIKKIFRKRTVLNKIFTALSIYKNIEEKNFHLHQLENKTGVLTSLNGYWQSAYYFENIRPLLLKEFIPLQLPQYPSWVNAKNTVAIHVRRTDYLLEERYGFIGEQYYERAISLMQTKIKDPLFVFFSDDIKWCRLNFKNDRTVFFEEQEWLADYLQLHLLSKCAHQIIANSSFSWWGAWLNTNPEKMVIRPATPFKEKGLFYEAHYPQEWISVSNN